MANEVFAVNNAGAHSGSCTSTHTTQNHALGSPAKSFASANSTVAEFLQGTGAGTAAGSETPSTSGSWSPNASAELNGGYKAGQTAPTGAASSGGGAGKVCCSSSGGGAGKVDDTAALLEEKYGALYDR